MMTWYLHSQSDLEAAIARLVRKDARLTPALEVAGMPSLRRRPSGFEGLAAIIVGQQLSTASARAIWTRLTAEIERPNPTDILRMSADRMASFGLSRAKTQALKTLAREIAEGRFDIETLGAREADDAHAILTALPGIGPWTADVYLLFCLGHGDAWPAGDLAVQEGMRIGLELSARPSAKVAGLLAEPWRPLRGAAAHLWWGLYSAVRRRQGAPVAGAAPVILPDPVATGTARKRRSPRTA